LTNLFSIANQCPLSGGEAVFKARAMVRLANDSLDWDDDQLCTQPELRKESEQLQAFGGEHALLFPNPTKGRLVVKFSKALTADMQISIRNIHGQRMANYTLLKGIDTFEMDVSSFSDGVYFVHLLGFGLNQIDKVIIVH
jgi:hypothetical protein